MKLFANQNALMSNLNRDGRPPLYFFSTSNATNPSDPNSLKDMGTVRNA